MVCALISTNLCKYFWVTQRNPPIPNSTYNNRNFLHFLAVRQYLLLKLYLFGILQGAWYGLVAGSITALCRIGIHFSYGTPNCGENKPDPRPAVFTKVHYLHFALILAGVTLIVTVIVSLLTEPRPERKVGVLNHLLMLFSMETPTISKYIWSAI